MPINPTTRFTALVIYFCLLYKSWVFMCSGVHIIFREKPRDITKGNSRIFPITVKKEIYALIHLPSTMNYSSFFLASMLNDFETNLHR